MEGLCAEMHTQGVGICLSPPPQHVPHARVLLSAHTPHLCAYVQVVLSWWVWVGGVLCTGNTMEAPVSEPLQSLVDFSHCGLDFGGHSHKNHLTLHKNVPPDTFCCLSCLPRSHTLCLLPLPVPPLCSVSVPVFSSLSLSLSFSFHIARGGVSDCHLTPIPTTHPSLQVCQLAGCVLVWSEWSVWMTHSQLGVKGEVVALGSSIVLAIWFFLMLLRWWWPSLPLLLFSLLFQMPAVFFFVCFSIHCMSVYALLSTQGTLSLVVSPTAAFLCVFLACHRSGFGGRRPDRGTKDHC